MTEEAIHSVTQGNSIGSKIREALTEQGQRWTRQKDQIANRLAELAVSGVDFTIEDLWQGLRQGDPHMGRATIFRAIEILANKGLLNRIDFADGSHTYRACGENHHHHLTCVQCHRVVEIEVCLPTEQFAIIGEQNNYRIEGHSLTLFGLCEVCQKEKTLEGGLENAVMADVEGCCAETARGRGLTDHRNGNHNLDNIANRMVLAHGDHSILECSMNYNRTGTI